MRSKVARVFLVFFVISSVIINGYAQVNNASITGLVADPTGAAVAGAVVNAKNQATNVDTEVKTDSSGYFTFPSLPVGSYVLTVEGQGFKKAKRDNVALEVGQKARIDFILQVGAVSETTSVVASAPILTTQEATTGGVIEIGRASCRERV